jgi:isochorismate synthase
MTAEAQKTSLHQFFLHCTFHNLPFALYRIPHAKDIRIIAQTSPISNGITANKKSEAKGFIFSPFHEDSYHQTVLIHPDIACKEADLAGVFQPKLPKKALQVKKKSFTQDEASKTDFKKYVKQARKKIRKKNFKKVVVARILKLRRPQGFSEIDFFKKLCTAYPHAFASLVFIPEYGIWIGASPEILLQLKSNRFTTYSLAGTRATPKKPGEKWGFKEKQEQKIVSDYILSTLKPFIKKKPNIKGPETVTAGNLQHLRTTFTCSMDNAKWAEVVTKLHPTPAVAGLPKAEAIDFILEHEKGARGFYSGYLGPLNIDKATHLFVNLRCMQVVKNKLAIHVGCGITADSKPSKEWKETELKAGTLLNILKV